MSSQAPARSLRSKIILILSIVMVAYVAIDFALQRSTVLRGFDSLERETATASADRVKNAIDREVEELVQCCRSWASLDDTVEFVEARVKEMLEDSPPKDSVHFAEAHLSATQLRIRNVDFVMICAPDGKVMHSSIVDPETGKPVELREFPRQALNRAHPFLVTRPDGSFPSGLMVTEHKPLLIAARPILSSNENGPPQGRMILGRFLSDTLDAVLSKRTKTEFDFWQRNDQGQFGHGTDEVLDEITTSVHPVVREADEQTLHVFASVNDFRRMPEFLVRVSFPREISGFGHVAVRYALISTICAGGIMLLILLSLLQRIVLSPLLALRKHAVEIGRTEDFRAKLRLKRDDEIGDLSREFDHMMEKLEKARAALVDTARAAGKSEIATGILHNVGNVLNSVNVSATLAAEKAQTLAVTDLEQLSELVREQADHFAEFVANDPRGAHVAPYLLGVTDSLKAQREELVKELEALTSGVEHIRELVKSQQSFAGKVEVEEVVSIAEIFDRAVQLSNRAEIDDKSLEIAVDAADVPEVLADRHKVLEIVVNLVQNARQAMESNDGRAKRLALKAFVQNEKVQMEVSDTGSGIAPENLAKIFNLGFTTKKSGHGFGLHAAANSATEMGGKLWARSEGPGKGATFVLEIPLKTPVRAAGGGA